MLDRLTVAFASQREFIRDVSHELRTPIAISRGHLELLAEGHLARQGGRREAIALVTGELDRMSRFVDDLLLLAKAESPDFLQLETVPLGELAAELVAKARAMADRRWRIDSASPRSIVADRQRITQAVMNLAQNAVAHTGIGDEIGIGASVDGDEASIWVRDTGTGIPASEQRRIFSRFSRGMHSRGRYEGTRDRARDRARDRRGPRRPRPGHQPAGGGRAIRDPAADRAGGARGGLGSGGGTMKRILIVEDEPGMASFIDKGLASRGYATKVCADGASATAIASDSDFDLVILDLGLPDVDGLSVLREIRRRGERMPVIVLTARDDLTDKVEGLDAGASDYVTKPFKLEELLARTRVQLRDERSSEPTVLEAGGITLDIRTRKAMASGAVVDLTAREFTMLETFMGHAGQVLSREQLLAHVWGYDYDPGSNVVEVYVRYLRRKLGEDAIETVRGMGYRLPG